MELITQNSNLEISPSLTSQENEIVLAVKTSISIREILETGKGEETLYEVVMKSYAKFPALSGQKQADFEDETPEIKEIRIEGIIDCLKQFKNIHTSEIEQIFEKGARGDFGDVYGLNAKAVGGWVRKYILEREKALKKQMGFEAEQKFYAEREGRRHKEYLEFEKSFADSVELWFFRNEGPSPLRKQILSERLNAALLSAWDESTRWEMWRDELKFRGIEKPDTEQRQKIKEVLIDRSLSATRAKLLKEVEEGKTNIKKILEALKADFKNE